MQTITTDNQQILPPGSGAMRITNLGVLFDGDGISESTIEAAMVDVGRAGESVQWCIGDMINYAERAYGEKYSRWAELTGYTLSTLRVIAHVCRKVPHENRRVGKLRFDHHREVRALPLDEQARWLRIAEEEGLNHKRLRESINAGSVVSEREVERRAETRAQSGYTTVQPHITGASVALGKMARDGSLDDLDQDSLLLLHSDFMPLIESYRREVLGRMRGVTLARAEVEFHGESR